MLKFPFSALIVLWASVALGEASWPVSVVKPTNSLEIFTVVVNGNSVPLRTGRELGTGPSPDDVIIGFGPANNSSWSPIRLRYKLEGYDTGWSRGRSEMNLSIRFYNDAQELIEQKFFQATGDSTGWTGSLKTSPSMHRRETIDVPPHASRLMAVISSAGPPSAIGIYVVDDLIVSRVSSTTGSREVLLRPIFEFDATSETTNQSPKDWVRDGTRPSMAKVFEIGQEPKTMALGVLDDDPIGHAEWHNSIQTAPQVSQGELLVVEWNELFSVGVEDTRSVEYHQLPPGDFRFRVQEQTVLGFPTGVEASLAIRVPVPWWKQSWLWATLGAALLGSSIAGTRYRTACKLRRELLRLKQQGELEHERLRIARDLHDDLGTLLTGISLLSDRAQFNRDKPEQMAGYLQAISQRVRSSVEALDGIVWAINPQNDTLDHLTYYLVQFAESFFRLTPIRCRLDVPEEVPHIRLGTQERHHVFMVAKEACNNIACHSGATEVWVRLRVNAAGFSLMFEDNGRGFVVGAMEGGDGLRNMRERIAEVGGSMEPNQ